MSDIGRTANSSRLAVPLLTAVELEAVLAVEPDGDLGCPGSEVGVAGRRLAVADGADHHAGPLPPARRR